MLNIISVFDYRISIFIEISIISNLDNVNMLHNKRAAPLNERLFWRTIVIVEVTNQTPSML